MPQALDLTGKIFGNLKAIKKAPSRSGKTYWECECLLCGSIKEYQTGHLTSGASKSCGCQRKSNFNPNISETEIEKICPICNDRFKTTARNRLYCYNCSPSQIQNSDADYQGQKKRAIKHQLIVYKGGKCKKCGYNKCEGALQFHHRDPKEKDFTISRINLSKSFSIENLYKEVDKCDLLCANCHSEEHYLNE